MTWTTDRPLRQSLHDEVHARPSAILSAPDRASHLALIGQGGHDETGHLAALCADFGPFRLKWEQHTEFFTYTFFVAGTNGDPFGVPAIQHVPEDWRAELSAQVLVPVDVAFEAAGTPERTAAEMSEYFSGNKAIGSQVAGGGARVWTDFQLHGAGASRYLIKDSALTLGQAGRTVQRLL